MTVMRRIHAPCWRCAGSPETLAEDYPDASALASYTQTAADWCRANGILAARENGCLDPQTPATRTEVVSALYQYRPLSGGEAPAPAQGGKILVAYFSNTNNTENVARHLETILGADLYQITQKVPYTAADLNYSDSGCRTNREQNDASTRPAIPGALPGPADYDVVFLVYPIWRARRPRFSTPSWRAASSAARPSRPSAPPAAAASAPAPRTSGPPPPTPTGWKASGSAAARPGRRWKPGSADCVCPPPPRRKRRKTPLR